MSHYRFAFSGMLAALLLASLGCWLLFGWSEQAVATEKRRRIEYDALRTAADARERELKERRASMPGLRAFLKAWDPHLVRASQEKDLSAAMRAGLESMAQRKLSLVTDQVTAPEPASLALGKRSVTVQRLSMRASGESLASLVTWLGEVEAGFPLARVEAWELAATGGSGLSLKLTLAHPTQLFPSRVSP